MKNYEAHKAAKVRGQNAINAFFNKHVPTILARLRPFVGQKVELKTGGFAQTFRKALAEITAEIQQETPASIRWRIYSSHGYSLWLEGDKCEDVPGDSGCHYMKQSHYLGGLSDGVLKDVIGPDRIATFKTDFTVEGILATLKEAEALEDKARNLKHSVEPFGNGLHGN